MEAADRSSAQAAAASELARGALRFGIALTTEQLTVFETYVRTLLFWRARLSLTGAATDLAIVRGHIIDSLAIARFLVPGSRSADLGSGAGFPGIPLAIVRPQSSIILIESRRKRANFLRDVVRRCALTNAEVIEGRAEDLPPQSAASFDVVVSRAVWAVSDLLTIAAGLLRTGGLAIAMKGPKGVAEVASETAFSEPDVTTYDLPGEGQRMLLVYRKR